MNYKDEWAKNNYDRIIVNAPKGVKAQLQLLATLNETSVNKLILQALEKMYGLDID